MDNIKYALPVEWSSMETKLDIMSGANAAGYAGRAYADYVMHLSGKFVFGDDELSVMRDVLSSRWRNLGSDVYPYRIVSLSASRVTRQLASLLGSWIRLFEHLAGPNKDYVEGCLRGLDDIASGVEVAKTAISKMIWPQNPSDTPAENLKQLCYTASRFFTCEPTIHGHGLEQLRDDSFQIAFAAHRNMQWAHDTFEEMFFKHFPEPPPLP